MIGMMIPAAIIAPPNRPQRRYIPHGLGLVVTTAPPPVEDAAGTATWTTLQVWFPIEPKLLALDILGLKVV